MTKKKRHLNKPPAKKPASQEPSATEAPTAEATPAAASPGIAWGKQTVPRVVSLIVLVVVLVVFGSLFFKVMRDFISPLFLAGVLAVIFEPLHKWFLHRLQHRRYMAAMATTTSVVLLVFVPVCWLGFQAALEIPELVTQFDTGEGETSTFVETTNDARRWVESQLVEQVGITIDLKQYLRDFGEKVVGSLAGYGVEQLLAAIGVLVGLSVMAFALYYFLADGPLMIESLMRLSPLDDDYELELLEKFSEVSRAVVLATLLSAVAQGLLAGVGYYFALSDGAPIFLLTVATMLMAIVPFIGAMAVWAPVALAIFCLRGEMGPEGEFIHTGFWPGLILAIYGFTIVSTVDNFIKPWVLHGQSNLHPLLALLSVLGGVSALGPIGILVGPMLVAFLQALLNMLRKELDRFGEDAAAT